MSDLPEHLRKISPLRSSWVLFREWSAIVFYFWLVIRFPYVWIWVPCYILLGRQSYALFVLYHEAAHGLLFKSKRINNLVGEWLCGAPITFILENFKSHFQHHKEPLAPTDPDLRMIGGYPVSKASLCRKLMRDFVGITNFKGHLRPDYTRARATSFKPYIPMLAVAALMWAILTGLGHPFYFFIFWMFPGASVAVVFVRLGVLSQHAGLKADRDQRRTARTVTSPFSFFFAPLNLNYHMEHHLYPQIPCYYLASVHKHLLEQGELAADNIYRRYRDVFKKITH